MATSRIVAVAALAVFGGALAAEGQQVSEKTNRDRKLITAEEIEAAHVNSAYEVVQKLRPEMLNRLSRPMTLGGGMTSRSTSGSTRSSGMTRAGAGGNDNAPGASSAAPDAAQEAVETAEPRTAAVFVDGTDMGGVDELKQIQANLVEEIRYLTGTDAGARYGPRYSAGVIEVRLKNH
jgi:hypothetical protein